MDGQPAAVIAVGGSAGSVPPLVTLLGRLPATLPPAVLVTVHIGERTCSRLPQILSRAGELNASQAEDGERLEAGRVYVAPPGRHLLVSRGTAVLSSGPRVNRHRPAVDVMLASVAQWARERTVAVILSGVLDDGAVGAALVDRAGGQVLVQDPGEAEFASMPLAALAAAGTARSAPVRKLADQAMGAVKVAAAGLRAPTESWITMGAVAGGDDMTESDDPGFLTDFETRLTRLACPECGGSMALVDLPRISYFRCHIGHQYGPQTLAAAQAEASEAKLWSAVAALEEHATILRYLRTHIPAENKAAAKERDDYTEEISRRAAELHAQARNWTSAPAELDQPSA